MRKTMIRILALLLCGLMLLGLATTAFADEAETSDNQEETTEELTEEALYADTIVIDSLEAFLAFGESCRLDSYSRNVQFVLETDIDLSGLDFQAIPIFCGTFEGNGHTISGLNITGEGSYQGLFRYVEAGAVVRQLQVEGTVAPDGSAAYVGGIAGRNSGLIADCAFTGSVEGLDQVGGIAGQNTLMGIIQNCASQGSVSGSHFVGGIVGENAGVIRSCENTADVNTTVKQNSVEITDISLDTLIGAESVTTVTDIGGIAGSSSGVIRSCVNRGGVGYPHIGYNIGGIAGSQTGYIVSCQNYGAVSGRKEVGGIAGQMEPATYMEFTEDTLQILEEQMGVLSSLTSQATANAQSAASAITGQLDSVDDYVDTAKDAIGSLLPTEEDPIVDMDTILAAQNALSSSLTGIKSSLSGIASNAQTLATNLSRDLTAVMNQVGAIGETLNNASDGLGGSVYDISDLDTEDDILAKITLCENFGDVLGDWNVGGVLGAAAYENDLDPEDDLTMGGDSSMNFDVQVRAVVLGCRNEGIVECGKQKAGGIVGWQYLGLVRSCVNTGNVEADGAQHVGGIVGLSEGYIRYCAAKCVLTGGSYVGGVAGEGKVISACGAMVTLTGDERTGAIAGWVEELSGEGEELPVLANYYLAVDGDLGGIDGISYAGKAECASEEVFFGMELLLDTFHTVTVRFIHEDGTIARVSLSYGEALTEELIPAVNAKEGSTGYWEGLTEADLSRVTFDLTFREAYIQDNATIASSLTDEKGLPMVLVQGDFTGAETVELREITGSDSITAWAFTLPESGTATRLRFRTPDGWEPEDLRIQVRGSDESWRDVEFTSGGSYLVFALQVGDNAFRVLEAEKDYTMVIAIASAAAVVILLTTLVCVIRKKKKK